MQKRKLSGFFLLLSLICLALFAGSLSKAQAAEPSPLLLFFSGNVHGETEACG